MLLGILIGGVIGFIAGALVFRNNSVEGEKIVDKVKDTVDKNI